MDLWGVGVTINWDVSDSISVRSITSYRDLASETLNDSDHAPIPVNEVADMLNQEQFSQELHLMGTLLDERMNWILGLYHFIISGANIDNTSQAVFGQFTWDMTDEFSLTAGFRYTDEDKTAIVTPDIQIAYCADERFGCPPFVIPSNPLTIVAPGESKATASELTPYLNISYGVNEDLLVYGSYSEGFRSGGFAQRITPPTRPSLPTFEPEFVTVYEAGFKWSGMDNTVRMTGAVFYTDYENLQTTVHEGAGPVSRRAPARTARTYRRDLDRRERAMTQMTAVVSGGSSGIGEAICQHLLEADYRVISLSRSPPAFRHRNLEFHSVDLTDLRATQEVADDIASRHEVTSVVNNAGAVNAKLLEEATVEDLHGLTNLHIGSAMILTKAALPAMKAARFGRIVNMSTRAILGLATRTCYSGTKAALVSITRTWAMELGPYGITVNCIAPGPVISKMFTEVVPEDSAVARALADLIPVKRIGNPDDCARATMFFLDPKNSYISGQLLFVCGGSSMGSLIDGGLNSAMFADD